MKGHVVPGTDSFAFVEELRQAPGARVVGGWPAVEGQIPHQISLRMTSATGSVSSCGGSIIEHNWVLTAAHCVANRVSFIIRLGLINLNEPLYLVETTQKFIHPGYVEWLGGVQTDDIALLKLDYSIPYGPTIQPIRLMNSEQKNIDYRGVVLTVSGYGRTDDVINGGVTSQDLLWTYLRGISNDLCRFFYSGSTVIQDQTICAEYYNHTSQSSCQGDSGGPLTVVDIDNKPTLVGIVSFGHVAGCNSIYPSAYVRPGHYHDWFTEITGLNFDWKSSDLNTSESEESPEESEPESESSESKEESSESKEESSETKEESSETKEESSETKEESNESKGDATEPEEKSIESIEPEPESNLNNDNFKVKVVDA